MTSKDYGYVRKRDSTDQFGAKHEIGSGQEKFWTGTKSAKLADGDLPVVTHIVHLVWNLAGLADLAAILAAIHKAHPDSSRLNFQVLNKELFIDNTNNVDKHTKLTYFVKNFLTISKSSRGFNWYLLYGFIIGIEQ